MRLSFLFIVGVTAMAVVGLAISGGDGSASEQAFVNPAPSTTGTASNRTGDRPNRRAAESEPRISLWTIDAETSRVLREVTDEPPRVASRREPTTEELRRHVRDAAAADRADPGDLHRLTTALFARVLHDAWRDDLTARARSVHRIEIDGGVTVDVVESTAVDGEFRGRTPSGIEIALPAERVRNIARDLEREIETPRPSDLSDLPGDATDDGTALLLRTRRAWEAGRDAEHRELLGTWMRGPGPVAVANERRAENPELALALETAGEVAALPDLAFSTIATKDSTERESEPETVLDLDGIEAELARARRDLQGRPDQDKLLAWIRRVDDWTHELETMVRIGHDPRGQSVAKRDVEAVLKKVRLFRVDANRKFGF